MLLRGVKLPQPALDNGDIQAVKSRAQHSGRSFGGAPFRNGRGGRMNYASNRNDSDRPNPFAAHLDPKFAPPGSSSAPMGMSSGWAPPGSGHGGYSRGPPPPPRGGSYHRGGHYSGQQHQNAPGNNYDYYGRSQQGYYQQGSYGNNSGNQYQGRHGGGGGNGGYGRGGYQGRDHYSSRGSGGGYGRY
ncbi:5'-_3' exoribonculease Dhp1 [Aspergillus aculeatinus CBS 121060]|uniref:Uncharacterized protein n=1 Tax=Aspergillus aculeatinus CBS 121060 TaxID=1448322 RepID=A0ACD1GWT3_9EURO|nr:hypothetical protein BO66DRAFT_206366 [Aspergillus aculeatinus CBS 121060]RAH65596.1 hypothetical protein BO66DRAFT_206366 [Aspergillus aculeatinus CBS 121060]